MFSETQEMSTLKEEILDPGGSDEILSLLLKHSFSPEKYYTLGLNLGLSSGTLDEIKLHGESDKQCLSLCLASWLKRAAGPTTYNLIEALQGMGEVLVAESIHKEKHPACFILLRYEEQIRSMVLKGYLLLHKSGLLSTMILSTSPTERKEAIMKSVKESVCLNHHNLEKLVHVLQLMDGTEMIGSEILEEYRQKYAVTPGYWVTFRLGAGFQLHVTKRTIMDSLETIREKMDDVIVDSIQAMKDIPSIKDLKRYVNLSEPALEKEMESCQTNSDVLKLVRSKCSVSDISPMESIITQFKVDDVIPTIEDYRASLLEFYEKLPLQSYFQDHSSSVDKVTLLIDQDVDDKAFNDIKSLIILHARQFDCDLDLSVIKDDC